MRRMIIALVFGLAGCLGSAPTGGGTMTPTPTPTPQPTPTETPEPTPPPQPSSELVDPWEHAAGPATSHDLKDPFATEPKHGSADIAVDSTPTGAEIRVDGANVGRSPWQGRLSAGSHMVEVSATGYLPSRTKVVVTPSKLLKLDIALVSRYDDSSRVLHP